MALAIFLLLVSPVFAQQYVPLPPPAPRIDRQNCVTRTHGNILTIRCDSSRVCPPGWHLHTDMVEPLTGRTISQLLGYGDPSEVTNSCIPTEETGVSQDGGRFETNMEVPK